MYLTALPSVEQTSNEMQLDHADHTSDTTHATGDGTADFEVEALVLAATDRTGGVDGEIDDIPVAELEIVCDTVEVVAPDTTGLTVAVVVSVSCSVLDAETVVATVFAVDAAT